MTVHYQDSHLVLHHGDCLDVLRELPDNSVDAVCTDPPYGIIFMGKHWDNHVDNAGFGAWCELWATECLRVLKPGGHMLAFGGSRTWHRLAVAVEDAGFEIRDSIAWLYGSGFPKSLDVSKAIDKAAGAERTEVSGKGWHASTRGAEGVTMGRFAEEYQAGTAGLTRDLYAPATDAARTWQGWGTALKPAFEPIVVGRKPLTGTVAANVLAHGTGALNVDGCRVKTSDSLGRPYGGDNEVYGTYSMERGTRTGDGLTGRWPTNVVLDDTQAAELDRQSGVSTSPQSYQRGASCASHIYGRGMGSKNEGAAAANYGDSGGASRFFPTFRYEAKAPTSERPTYIDANGQRQAHATVKPLDLMRWLVRLVTPPGGTVLEPFAGSGTTAEACVLEGFQCIAIEREADYLPLIVSRLAKPLQPGFDLGDIA